MSMHKNQDAQDALISSYCLTLPFGPAKELLTLYNKQAVPYVFQELQSPQRPFHWLNSPPHSVHLKTVDFFAAAAAE